MGHPFSAGSIKQLVTKLKHPVQHNSTTYLLQITKFTGLTWVGSPSNLWPRNSYPLSGGGCMPEIAD